MKKSLFAIFAAAALSLGGALSLNAQEPVSTGIIQGALPFAGMLTVRSDQTQRPLTFYGLERANIFTADGQMAGIGDLQPGLRVTVQYAARGRCWYVSKVILPDQRSIANGSGTSVGFGGGSLQYRGYNYGPYGGTGLEYNSRVLQSPSLYDRDITTNPSGSAAFDNDITTQPASSGARSGVHRRAP